MINHEFKLQVEEITSGFRTRIKYGQKREVEAVIYHILDHPTLDRVHKIVLNEVLRILKTEKLV